MEWKGDERGRSKGSRTKEEGRRKYAGRKAEE